MKLAIINKASSLVKYPFSTTVNIMIRDSIKHPPIIIISFLPTLKPPQRIGRSPKTKVIWHKLEATESPTSISPCPRLHAIMELTISGRSVPIDTNVIPITRFETPSEEAKIAAFLTAILAQYIITAIPTILFFKNGEMLNHPIEVQGQALVRNGMMIGAVGEQIFREIIQKIEAT